MRILEFMYTCTDGPFILLKHLIHHNDGSGAEHADMSCCSKIDACQRTRSHWVTRSWQKAPMTSIRISGPKAYKS